MSQPSDRGTVEPISTRVTRLVPQAKVAEFEDLLHEVIIAARTFEGHLGVDVLRPEGGGAYQIIFRYRSHAEHSAWMDSEQRRRLVARVDEGWFVTPGYAPPAPPRRWKMAAITLGALYPILLILITALLPLTAPASSSTPAGRSPNS